MKTICAFLILVLFQSLLFSAILEKKRILYIDSYHLNYGASNDIITTFINTLNKAKINFDLKIIRMDTKRNKSEDFKRNAAIKAKRVIEKYKPDLVIAAEDNASKYLIVPYYKNSKLPFLFIGVNESAKEYGFPYENVTEQVEVTLIKPLISLLKQYSKGSRIAYLNDNTLTSKKTSLSFEKKLGVKIQKHFINSTKEWKDAFLKIQETSDILLLGFNTFSTTKKNKDIVNFVHKNTKIITASWDKGNTQISLIVYSKNPKEYGEWAGTQAIKILNGKNLSSIKISENKKGKVYINARIMKKLKILFPFELLDNSTIIK